MPVIRPYYVTFDEVEHLAVGYNSRYAKWNLLGLHGGTGKLKWASERRKLIDTDRVSAREAYPYKVIDSQVAEYVFAFSAQDAADRRTLLPGDYYSVPCDSWYVLNEMSMMEPHVLADLCLMTWKHHRDDDASGVGKVVPFVWQRKRSHGREAEEWKKDISPSMKQLMVAQLRLAMELPFIPDKRVHAGSIDGLDKRYEEEQHKDAVKAFTDLHKDNIGIRMVNYLLNVVGPCLRRQVFGMSFDDDAVVRDGLVQFCKAYGYDANTMRWAEILALWQEGVVGLEKRKMDESLGKFDMFNNGG